jgi:hypothetical protein
LFIILCRVTKVICNLKTMKRSNIKLQASVKQNKIRYQGKKHIENPDTDLEGYPEYPPEEDIYVQFKEEPEINPEEPDKPKIFNTLDDAGDADTVEISGKDLDIPGAELDDDQERLGSEDEENNHYSIGGDNHNDLEESRGQ